MILASDISRYPQASVSIKTIKEVTKQKHLGRSSPYKNRVVSRPPYTKVITPSCIARKASCKPTNSQTVRLAS